MGARKLLMKRSARFEGLNFEKTGVQIKKSVRELLTNIEFEMGRIGRLAEPLCLKHELSFKEIIDEERERAEANHPFGERCTEAGMLGQMTQYALKAEGRTPGLRGNQNKLQEIQVDMGHLAILAHSILDLEEEKGSLTLIIDHLNETYTFVLSYDQMVELGF